MIDLFGTQVFLEVRNEFRAVLQAGAREVRFLGDSGRSDAVRLLAATSNGVPIFLDEERLPGLRKGGLRATFEWCRLFIEANGAAFPGVMIVRENGTAMFVRLLPGSPVQVTVDVTEPAAFNEAGDGLRGSRALQLDRVAAAVLLNPWTVTRPPADPAQVDLYTMPGKGPGQVREGKVAATDLLTRSVVVSVVTASPEEVEAARVILMGILDSYQRSRASCEHLYGLMEEAGRSGLSDAAFEQALDSLPEKGQDVFGQLVNGLIDVDYEWEGFMPRPSPDWTYRGDYAVKWVGHKACDLQVGKYQRLLRAWEIMVRKIAGLLDLEWTFTPGFLMGDEDYLAEISEWGGQTFVLLNPQGLRVSAAKSETVLLLRDRAAHVVAHVGCPNHDEVWARRYGFLLEESAPLLSAWARDELAWVSSYGASTIAKGVPR